MGNLGFSELVVIVLVALVVVGPKRLPELAKACGEAMRAFRESLTGDSSRDSDAVSSDDSS